MSYMVNEGVRWGQITSWGLPVRRVLPLLQRLNLRKPWNVGYRPPVIRCLGAAVRSDHRSKSRPVLAAQAQCDSSPRAARSGSDDGLSLSFETDCMGLGGVAALPAVKNTVVVPLPCSFAPQQER